MPATPDDDRRFQELILLVARSCERDRWFGATKLNKLLFWIDFRHYRGHGRSVSGQVYQKLQHGPAPRGLKPAVQDMEDTGLCVWADRDCQGYLQKRLIALREPDVSIFDAEEVQLVHQVIQDLWDLNGSEVSDLSHRFVGWQAAEFGEDIPYGMVFIRDPTPLSAEEEARAEEAIREYLTTEAASSC